MEAEKPQYPRYASTTIAPFGGSGRGISEVLDVVVVVVVAAVILVVVRRCHSLFVVVLVMVAVLCLDVCLKTSGLSVAAPGRKLWTSAFS